MVSDLNIFFLKRSKIAEQKKVFFFADFALQNMVETTLPGGLETSGQRVYRYYWHISRAFWAFAFWMIFSGFQNIWVFGYSWSSLLWYRCYYPHRSRDALSPVCGNFIVGTAHFSACVRFIKSPRIYIVDQTGGVCQHATVKCRAVQCKAVYCSAMQCRVKLSAVQCSSASVVLCSAV